MVAAKRGSVVKAIVASLFASGGCGILAARAEDVPAADSRLDAITVTATRQAEHAADEQVERQVKAALQADPFFYDAHVTMTINHGVLTLHGIVFDDWDLRNVMRIARRVPGVKRVINDLELALGGE